MSAAFAEGLFALAREIFGGPPPKTSSIDLDQGGGAEWKLLRADLRASAKRTLAALRAASFLRRAFAFFAMAIAPAFSRALADPLDVTYEGSLTMEAHDKHPHATRTYHSRQRFIWDGASRLRLDWTTWAEGDSSRDAESTLLLGERVLVRGAGESKWMTRAGAAKDETRFQALAGVPGALLAEAHGENPANLCGRSWAFDLGEDGIPTRVVANFGHPRYGDVRDSVAFGEAPSPSMSSPLAPSTLQFCYAQQHDRFWCAESLIAASAPSVAFLDSLLAAPADSLVTPPDPERAPSAPRVERIADRVWAIDRDDVDSRTLVVELTDGLAVLESALDSVEGERLLGVIREHWPTTPIRWFLYSHYHPHYLGGFRPFVAAGATVVTSPGNADFVKESAAAPFTIAPDLLAREPAPLHVKKLRDGRFTIPDGAAEIVALDVGQVSQHTDEFVVFWLPRQRLLFQSELGWFPRDGKVVASRRARGLLQFLDERGIAPERFVQSWPVVDNRRDMSMTELRELVGPPPEK